MFIVHSVLRNLWKLKSSNFVHSASMFDSYTETSDRFFILKLTACMTSQLVPYRNFQKTKLFTQPLITTGKKDKKIFTISNLSGVSVDCQIFKNEKRKQEHRYYYQNLLMIILTIKFIVVPSVKNKKIKSYACMHLLTKKLLSKNGGLKSFNTKKINFLSSNK